MTVSAFYNISSTNNNRMVRFMVEGRGGSSLANIFTILRGPSSQYPRAGQVAAPTDNQQLAQLRTNLVVRALSVYAPAAYISVATDSAAHASGALVIGWEVDRTGVFFNNAWTGDTTLAKNLVTDIVDGVGTGGMSSPKTKLGLKALLAALSGVTYDSGTTGPFGTLSASGAIVLPSQFGGGTTAAAPALNAGVAAGFESGLQITLLSPQ